MSDATARLDRSISGGSSGQPASDWPAIVKAITGHALCEACVALDVQGSVSRVADVFRRMRSLLHLQMRDLCERCGSNVNVHCLMDRKLSGGG